MVNKPIETKEVVVNINRVLESDFTNGVSKDSNSPKKEEKEEEEEEKEEDEGEVMDPGPCHWGWNVPEKCQEGAAEKSFILITNSYQQSCNFSHSPPLTGTQLELEWKYSSVSVLYICFQTVNAV